MSKKKPAPDAPVTSNPFKGALNALKKEMEREAVDKPAEKPSPPKPAPVTKAVSDVWRPDRDAELFAVAMYGVQPLANKSPERVSAREPGAPRQGRTPLDLKTRRAHAEGGRALQPEVSPEGVVTCAHPGRSFALEALQRFATPDDSIDLHGLNEAEAALRAQEFVRTRRARRLRCVLIVHGRGKRSPAGDAVLRDAVVKALSEPPTCNELDAFASAPDHLGGVGAMMVSLRG